MVVTFHQSLFLEKYTIKKSGPFKQVLKGEDV